MLRAVSSMPLKRELVWATAASAALLLATKPASAEPFTKEQVQLALGVAYGVYLGEAAQEIPSPYGFGIGARAGYTLGLGIYFGGEANYFFGASRRFPEYGDVEGKLALEDEEEVHVMRLAVGFAELAVVEATRVVVEALDGEGATDERLLEAMLAEGETALLVLEGARPSGGEEDDGAQACSAALLR